MNKPFLTDAHDAPVIGGDPGALEAFFGEAMGDGPQRAPRRSQRSLGGDALAGLIEAYRARGYLRADLDPLGLWVKPHVPELSPERYGLDAAAVPELVRRLETTYCGAIGWDIAHIHDSARRQWLIAQAEVPPVARAAEARVDILRHLVLAEAFEKGLTTRIPAGKLFGLGGAESFNLLVETILVQAARAGVGEVVVGGMHRGRFNMLANVMGKPLGPMVAEILGKPAVPEGLGLSSDVSYHLGYSGERTIEGRWEALLMDSAREHDEASWSGTEEVDEVDAIGDLDAAIHEFDDEQVAWPPAEPGAPARGGTPLPKAAAVAPPPAPPPPPPVDDEFAITRDRAVDALLVRDFATAARLFAIAHALRPDDGGVNANLERLAALGFASAPETPEKHDA